MRVLNSVLFRIAFLEELLYEFIITITVLLSDNSEL